MKKYKRFFEMANISTKYSGLSKGVVQIRPEERHSLFPHVHFVYDVKKADKKYVKLFLAKDEKDIKIIKSKNLELNSKELLDLKRFIIKNYELLKSYYLQAEFLDTGDFFLKLNSI